MPKYKIEIEETLQRVEEIDANNLEEALEIAEEKYRNNEIELDYNDFKGHEIKEYRETVKEEDLFKNSIFNINYGKAILLEGNKNLALIKRLDVESCSYVVVSGLTLNDNKTQFEWLHGSYFDSLSEASNTYEKYFPHQIQDIENKIAENDEEEEDNEL